MQSGRVLHVFPSALPNGSAKSKKQSSAVFSIFDSVFHEADHTYYIVDVLAWNGVHLCASDVDFRMPWARGHFEASPAAREPFPGHRFRMRMCEMHLCNEAGMCDNAGTCSMAANAMRFHVCCAGMASAYSGVTPYAKDGLLFLHGRSPYTVGEATSSPLALRWKDASCSRWPIDTNPDNSVQTDQHVVRTNAPNHI